MATNGTPVLSPADKRKLAAPPVSSPFDAYDRLFPAFDGGKVFTTGEGDARQIREMLRRDGQARKVEQVLTLPIRAAAWEIRPAPQDSGEKAWVDAQLGDKLDRVIDQLTTAVAFRKAFFEITFDLDGDTLMVTEVGYRPPASCEQAFDPKTGKPAGFRQRVASPGGVLAVQPGATMRGDAPGYVTIRPERSFVFVHGSYREPIEGLSDLDVAYWAWEQRQKILFLWFQFLEQQSLPKIIMWGDDQTQADRNADAMAEAKASGVLGMARPADPQANGFDIVESSGAGSAQFLQAVSYLESQMSASVLAGFTDLTALASHARSQGSYALSADQSEFFLAARQAVADEIADAVTADLFGPLCEMQFGPDCHPPTLSIGPLSKHDKERALQMLTGLLTADHFNAPPQLVDLLIKSVAGYVGLPVDQVTKAVDEHPTQDPATVAAQLKAQAGAQLAGQAGTGQSPDQTVTTFRQLAGLAHTVDTFTERTHAGEDPREVVADLTGKPWPTKPKRRSRRRRGVPTTRT